jgi:hypothetical protein
MSLYSKTDNFWSQLFPRRAKQKSLAEIAIAEELDEFVEIESCNQSRVEYNTVHGWRMLSTDRPELNQFFVFKRGKGFAKALAMSYIRFSDGVSNTPQLIVQSIVSDAAIVGYAAAVSLPYYITGTSDGYPTGTLVVCINETNTEAIGEGYANALLCMASKSSVYIEDMRMLDTDYADSLLDVPRFG